MAWRVEVLIRDMSDMTCFSLESYFGRERHVIGLIAVSCPFAFVFFTEVVKRIYKTILYNIVSTTFVVDIYISLK